MKGPGSRLVFVLFFIENETSTLHTPPFTAVRWISLTTAEGFKSFNPFDDNAA